MLLNTDFYDVEFASLIDLLPEVPWLEVFIIHGLSGNNPITLFSNLAEMAATGCFVEV